MLFLKNILPKCLLTLFLWSSVFYFQQDKWKHFDIKNSGLPSNTIRSVTQDAKGVYWICTWDGGLTKFDGKNWKTFDTKNSGLTNNCVYFLAFDCKGNIYIGTMGGGLLIFDGKKKWKVFNQKNSGRLDLFCYTG
jgi:ligand-binding sensor domain-containing protein